MGDRYASIAFTECVKSVQEELGSRRLYENALGSREHNGRLGPNEVSFINRRDGFYIASISETGWPYLQFRGGPEGFLRVLDSETLGFADFRGNRQYVRTGNAAKNDRVSLFLIDYAHGRRLKVFGRARIVARSEDSELAERLTVAGYPGVVERVFVIGVEAFNWNCPQHITPRYTEAEFVERLGKSGSRAAAEAYEIE